MPTVSVIMAVYNEETTVALAIESVIAQTYNDWELIIINDCSTDRTPEITGQYAVTYDKIRVLANKQNIGLAASLNKGIKEAQGKYIVRMDSDDYSHLERFEKQVTFMKANPDVDVLGTGAELIDENGKTITCINLPETHDEIAATIHKMSPFFHPSVIIRKEFLDRSGGYNNRLRNCQDFDLWSRMFRQSTYHNLQEPLIRYQTKSYKRPLKTILYSLYVHMRNLRYNGKIFQGSFWAIMVTLKSLLVNWGLYKPKSLRIVVYFFLYIEISLVLAEKSIKL